MQNINYNKTNTLECIPDNTEMYFAHLPTSCRLQEA